MKTRLKYLCTADYPSYRDHMLDLHRRESGRVSERLYDSLYLGNPYGPPLIGLCFDEEKLIGQESYIRQDIVFEGNIRKSALGINTIVDPNYRIVHGVFKELVKMTMEEMKACSDVLCAYANEESKRYYLKYFGWKVASKVEVYKKSIGPPGLSPERILALFRTGKMDKDLNLRKVNTFKPSELSRLIEGHRQSAQYIYFYKTADFLNWKYLENKHYELCGYHIEYKGAIRGYVVTYADGIELKIVDFLIENDDVEIFEKLISALAFMGSRMGKKRLMIYSTPDCWYSRSLKRNFFIHRWDFEFITANLNGSFIEKPWIIQMGDFDIL